MITTGATLLGMMDLALLLCKPVVCNSYPNSGACWVLGLCTLQSFSITCTIVPLWLALVSSFSGRGQGLEGESRTSKVSTGVGTQARGAVKWGLPPTPVAGSHRGVAGHAGTCILSSLPDSGPPSPTCSDLFQEMRPSQGW